MNNVIVGEIKKQLGEYDVSNIFALADFLQATG
jgi:hypothetical protein